MNDDARRRLLREFLMARRAAISPASAGLPSGERRRAVGLRREEVAALADVGLSWYTWLEQGRDINVSAEALERIATALRLSASDVTYLFGLAGVAREPSPALEAQVREELQVALDGFAVGPALVVDACWNVEAFNRLADLVFRFKDSSSPFGRNHFWRMFMDPERRELYMDWVTIADLSVGALRVAYSKRIGDPDADALVQSLVEGSPEFARRWAQQSTTSLVPLAVRLRLPGHGEGRFTTLRFRYLGSEDRILVLMTPSDEATTGALARLSRSREVSTEKSAPATRKGQL
jgi:transcriptional regulator with XRE-family HTH domain